MAGARKPGLREVLGITDPDWKLWWGAHPATLALRQFLEDRKEFLKQTALELWLAGKVDLRSNEYQAIRGQIIEIDELLSLTFDKLTIFYEGEEGGGETPG